MNSILRLVVASLLAISVAAAPYEKRWNVGVVREIEKLATGSRAGTPGCTGDSPAPPPAPSGPAAPAVAPSGIVPQPALKKSYLTYEKRVASTGSCDVQNAIQNMDLNSVSPPLPAPASGLTLAHVALGRGTQNYTCDPANATATPVAVGALASLFDFSCVASEDPALLNTLPNIALDLPTPSDTNTNSQIVNQYLIGHHYFLNSTTPFFNLDTSAHQYGMGAMAKANASDAPANAPKGQPGQDNGAVQWLRLTQMKFVEDAWMEVYRTHTAGGNPPTECNGATPMPPSFQVQYSALYWIFT